MNEAVQPGAAQQVQLPATPTADVDWIIIDNGFALAREHEIESVFTVANGCLGVRGSLPEGTSLSDPATFVAGVFDVEPTWSSIPGLLVLADWTDLRVFIDGRPLTLETTEIVEHRRVLDMKQGMLWREWTCRDDAGRITRLRMLRFASLHDRDLAVQCALVAPENFSCLIRLESRIGFSPVRLKRWQSAGPLHPLPVLRLLRPPSERERCALFEQEATNGRTVSFACATTVHASENGEVRATVEAGGDSLLQAWEWQAQVGSGFRLDRIVGVDRLAEPASQGSLVVERVDAAARRGVAAAIERHDAAWGARWRASDVQVEGDDDAQRALRFAIYHLVSAANPDDPRVSIGARALTGEAYRGHVFWDTEIYLLPFYVYTDPAAARSLLDYRYVTLPGARRKAQAMGYGGALYAWESTDTGDETTPRTALTPGGEVVRILTGEEEHHISADVAFAVWQYWQATADDAFFVDEGAEILIETARFWASRGQVEQDGCYHIRRVIGPDEYHETIDDNAYTNVMAKWNLERGAEAAGLLQQRWPDAWQRLCSRLAIAGDEPAEWRRLAAAMRTGFDRRTSLFEQFEGYFGLEDISLASYEPRTAPMDIVLQRDRLQGSKIIKQADVVALAALLWDDYPRYVHEANFRYYEPRTGHGSSLSPAMHALVAARLGDDLLFDRYFRQAAEIDLANNMGNASGGVHIAALGGLWQATVLGVGGLRPREDGLVLAPHLPRTWAALSFRVQWRGRTVAVRLDRARKSVAVCVQGAPMTIGLDGGQALREPAGAWWQARQTGRDAWSAWERA